MKKPTYGELSMDDPFVIREQELTGFGLGGYVQLNGTIQLLGSNRFIKKWPEEIYFMGTTYTLESIEDGVVDEVSGVKWQNAEYL
jgi:hypothetical protein